ncbi:hypothetical protein HanXRQr2_Chr13g0567471 [Helianthus annuus]|uniref:Uncharacterized protein n=1 Tax=Helianthus annuus TaxID=4232 RepID=A0A9K3EEJ0_HELAN|nr:hypothetical protein HanXRQr2_Chr13g0567471 [Helianthus annuus]
MNKELKPNRCLFHNLHYKTHPFSPFPTKPFTFLTDSPPNRFILISFTKFSSKSINPPTHHVFDPDEVTSS